MAFQLEFESQILHLGAVGWWTSKFTSPNHSSLCAKYIASYVSRPKSSERKMIHLSQCTGSWKMSESVLVVVVAESLQPHGLDPARLLCPWEFSGKNTGVGCHFFLQGIFPDLGLNLSLLHWQVDPLPWSPQGSPSVSQSCQKRMWQIG